MTKGESTRMKFRRILAGLVTLAALAALLVLPASAAGSAAFSDISDPDVAEAAQVLRLLGVVDGTGGNSFNPGGTLTRAQFCKMAVDVMDKGALEPAQRSRTIFSDVGPRHWARGYVNLASTLTTSGEAASSGGEGQKADRLILGVGNGTFQPDRPITYGEAVAILVRILGYNTGDISGGAAWYDGYLAAARQNGLTEGLSLGGGETITRAQAAILFRNLLFTDMKDSDSCYLEVRLKGVLTEDVTLLSMDANQATGSSTVTVAVGGQTQSPRTDRAAVSSSLMGVRGQMVQDKDGRFLTLRPNSADSVRRVTVSGPVDANYVTAAGGEKITIPPETPVWKNGEATSFDKVWSYLYSGTSMVLCYGAAGKLDYIYLSPASSSGEDVMVARTDPKGSNPFAALTGGDKDYQIYKNGVPASVSDLRQYDTAFYDSGARILHVSDLRLTGLYENAYPNPTAPSRITMLGQDFTVLPGAVSDLAAFRPGEDVTLLLTSDGRVAGAVSPSTARSTTVGVVESCSAGEARVVPLMDLFNAGGEHIVFQGDPDLSESSAAKLVGQLVTVSSHKAGHITLSRLTGSGASDTLDVAARTLGGVKLAENVRMFERVGAGTPREITFRQLTRAAVPASRIQYVGKDYAGKINLLLFDDVTGDQYEYGFAKYSAATQDPDDPWSFTNASISVENGGSGLGPLTGGSSFRNGDAIGIARSLETRDGRNKLAGSVALESLSGIRRSAYDPDARTITGGGMVLPVSDQVWCYNKTTGHWFSEGLDGLEEARAYSDDLTVYYDKAPEQGGKVRLVVVR